MISERVAAANSEIEDALSKARDRSIQALVPFVGRELEEGQVYACFELWWEQDYSLGYNRFFIKEVDGRQHLETDWGLAGEEGVSFIPEIVAYFDDYYNNMSKDTELMEDEGIDFSTLLEESIFKWFSSCWEAAGGEQSKVPTYFCFEKEYMVRDLKTGEVLSESAAAQKFGYTVEI